MAKTIKVFFIIFSLLLIANGCLLIANNVQAATLWDLQDNSLKTGVSRAFGSAANPSDIRIIVADFVSVFLSFIGLIFLIFIIYGGFKWMTAGGNETRVMEAQSLLKRSIIGLIIIFSAWVISVFVSNQIEKAVSGQPLSIHTKTISYNYGNR